MNENIMSITIPKDLQWFKITLADGKEIELVKKEDYLKLQQENKELARLVANKVIIDYDYDSILKNELIEERRRNITLEESKNMTKNILNELESWFEEEIKKIGYRYLGNEFADGIKYGLQKGLDKLKELKGDYNDENK